jgi:hypothetical protein
MLHDFAFYGSAAWIAIFLALVLLNAIEHLLRSKQPWRFGIRGLFAAITLVAVALGIFCVVAKQ